jgi:hypothetical protein
LRRGLRTNGQFGWDRVVLPGALRLAVTWYLERAVGLSLNRMLARVNSFYENCYGQEL